LVEAGAEKKGENGTKRGVSQHSNAAKRCATKYKNRSPTFLRLLVGISCDQTKKAREKRKHRQHSTGESFKKEKGELTQFLQMVEVVLRA